MANPEVLQGSSGLPGCAVKRFGALANPAPYLQAQLDEEPLFSQSQSQNPRPWALPSSQSSAGSAIATQPTQYTQYSQQTPPGGALSQFTGTQATLLLSDSEVTDVSPPPSPPPSSSSASSSGASFYSCCSLDSAMVDLGSEEEEGVEEEEEEDDGIPAHGAGDSPPAMSVGAMCAGQYAACVCVTATAARLRVSLKHLCRPLRMALLRHAPSEGAWQAYLMWLYAILGEIEEHGPRPGNPLSATLASLLRDEGSPQWRDIAARRFVAALLAQACIVVDGYAGATPWCQLAGIEWDKAQAWATVPCPPSVRSACIADAQPSAWVDSPLPPHHQESTFHPEFDMGLWFRWQALVSALTPANLGVLSPLRRAAFMDGVVPTIPPPVQSDELVKLLGASRSPPMWLSQAAGAA